MRVVLRSRYTLELTGSHQLTHQDVASAFDSLAAVVGELHGALVKADAVTINREHGTRAEDVGVKTFLLKSVILRQTCFVNQVHRLFHRVFDVFVIRRQGEEIVVDFLYIMI